MLVQEDGHCGECGSPYYLPVVFGLSDTFMPMQTCDCRNAEHVRAPDKDVVGDRRPDD